MYLNLLFLKLDMKISPFQQSLFYTVWALSVTSLWQTIRQANKVFKMNVYNVD